MRRRHLATAQTVTSGATSDPARRALPTLSTRRIKNSAAVVFLLLCHVAGADARSQFLPPGAIPVPKIMGN